MKLYSANFHCIQNDHFVGEECHGAGFQHQLGRNGFILFLSTGNHSRGVYSLEFCQSDQPCSSSSLIVLAHSSHSKHTDTPHSSRKDVHHGPRNQLRRLPVHHSRSVGDATTSFVYQRHPVRTTGSLRNARWMQNHW